MESATATKRLNRLRALLRRATFEGWPHDHLAAEIDKLYRSPRASKKTG